MKHLLLISALISASCASYHTPAAPPSGGYFGRVRPPRQLYILMDDEMSPKLAAEVIAAVAELNEVAGAEILHYAGPMTLAEAQSRDPSEDVTIVCEEDLPTGPNQMILGVTRPMRFEKNGYFHMVVVSFSPVILKDGCMLSAVVRHELLHSLGAKHTDGGPVFGTLMAPMYDPLVCDLTPADISALRATYVER